MKKKLFNLLLITSSLFYLSFSKPIKVSSVKGYIKVQSNDPFSYLIIENDAGKKYAIKTNKEDEKKLRDNQGKKIQIDGIIYKEEKTNVKVYNQSKDGFIEVQTWKILNQ